MVEPNVEDLKKKFKLGITSCEKKHVCTRRQQEGEGKIKTKFSFGQEYGKSHGVLERDTLLSAATVCICIYIRQRES